MGSNQPPYWAPSSDPGRVSDPYRRTSQASYGPPPTSAPVGRDPGPPPSGWSQSAPPSTRTTRQDEWQTVDVLDQSGSYPPSGPAGYSATNRTAPPPGQTYAPPSQGAAVYGGRPDYPPVKYERPAPRPMEDDRRGVMIDSRYAQPMGPPAGPPSGYGGNYEQAGRYPPPARSGSVSGPTQSLMYPADGERGPMPGYKPHPPPTTYPAGPAGHPLGRHSPPPTTVGQFPRSSSFSGPPPSQNIKQEYYRQDSYGPPSAYTPSSMSAPPGTKMEPVYGYGPREPEYQRPPERYSYDPYGPPPGGVPVKREPVSSAPAPTTRPYGAEWGGPPGAYEVPMRRPSSPPPAAKPPPQSPGVYSQGPPRGNMPPPSSYGPGGYYSDPYYNNRPTHRASEVKSEYGRPTPTIQYYPPSNAPPHPLGAQNGPGGTGPPPFSSTGGPGPGYVYRDHPTYQQYTNPPSSYDPSGPPPGSMPLPSRTYSQGGGGPPISPRYPPQQPPPGFGPPDQKDQKPLQVSSQGAMYPSPMSGMQSPSNRSQSMSSLGPPSSVGPGDNQSFRMHNLVSNLKQPTTSPSTPDSLYPDRVIARAMSPRVIRSKVPPNAEVDTRSVKRTNEAFDDEDEDDDLPINDTLGYNRDPVDLRDLRRKSSKILHFHDRYAAHDIIQHQPPKKPSTLKSKRPRMFEPNSFGGLSNLPNYHITGNGNGGEQTVNGGVPEDIKDKLSNLHIESEGKLTGGTGAESAGDDAMKIDAKSEGVVVVRKYYHGFYIGELVQVNNDEGTWQAARVRFVDESGVFVHYEGWGVEYDEWVAHHRVIKCTSPPPANTMGPKGKEDDDRWERIRKIVEEMHGRYHTGIVFDSTMMKHECCCKEPETWHPEQPARIAWILECMDQDALIDRCIKVRAREVTNDELALVHTEKHIQTYGIMSDTDKPKIEPEIETMECGGIGVACDTVYNKDHSPLAAYYATGSLLEIVQKVVQGDLQNGFAVIRPPGHHAEESEALGFCFFNNVSVAATFATQHMGIKRVLIVDWDVHHGNGTQNMFYSSQEVMYISLHRHDDGRFYPFTGAPDECGEGEGEGYNINIAWRGKQGCSNAEYLAAFRHVIIPIAQEYKPELVIVSAGFDAAEGDLIGGYCVTPEGYAHMTYELMQLAGGKIVLSLEGGYDYGALPTCATACMRVLLGEEVPLLPYIRSRNQSPRMPTKAAIQVLKNVINIQKKHWPTLEVPKTWEIPSREFNMNNNDSSRKSNRGK